MLANKRGVHLQGTIRTQLLIQHQAAVVRPGTLLVPPQEPSFPEVYRDGVRGTGSNQKVRAYGEVGEPVPKLPVAGWVRPPLSAVTQFDSGFEEALLKPGGSIRGPPAPVLEYAERASAAALVAGRVHIGIKVRAAVQHALLKHLAVHIQGAVWNVCYRLREGEVHIFSLAHDLATRLMRSTVHINPDVGTIVLGPICCSTLLVYSLPLPVAFLLVCILQSSLPDVYCCLPAPSPPVCLSPVRATWTTTCAGDSPREVRLVHGH
jgi:hypothetical protein